MMSWQKTRAAATTGSNAASVSSSQHRATAPPGRSANSRWRESWRAIVLGLAAVTSVYAISQLERATVPSPAMPKASTGETADTESNSAPDFTQQRVELYSKLETDRALNGLHFLAGGETTQNLKLSDIFKVTENGVEPVLKRIDVPVRANVLHIEPAVAKEIAKVVEDVLSAHFSPTACWYQDPEMYHMSMYHASHDKDPVPATDAEVEEEALAVGAVVNRTCPLKVELMRTVITSTGVVMGLWQLMEGAEPALLRDDLKRVLPRSPRQQIYSRAILHTSFARVIDFPNLPQELEDPQKKLEATKAIMETVTQSLNEQLVPRTCTISELWYVEELDLLALALRGAMRTRRLKLRCGEL